MPSLVVAFWHACPAGHVAPESQRSPQNRPSLPRSTHAVSCPACLQSVPVWHGSQLRVYSAIPASAVWPLSVLAVVSGVTVMASPAVVSPAVVFPPEASLLLASSAALPVASLTAAVSALAAVSPVPLSNAVFPVSKPVAGAVFGPLDTPQPAAASTATSSATEPRVRLLFI